MSLVLAVLEETWGLLLASSGWLLVGMVLAALLHAWVPRTWIQRGLGGEGLGAVARASLAGAPLPLCSCAVVPTASALRRAGAGRGPTAAFLIATPETGVDSIGITWALFDPLTTVLRPLTAITSALVAGVWVGRSRPGEAPRSAATEEECCPSEPSRGALRRAAIYFVGPLLDDLARPLALGFALAGLVGAVLPDGLFGLEGTSPLLQMLGALALGLPTYVCATASTPLAAALVSKGLDPGAALVFLLAGPATNLATWSVVHALLGRAAAWRSFLVIALGALAGGGVLHALGGGALSGAPSHSHDHATDHATAEENVLRLLTAALLAVMILSRLLPLRSSNPSHDHHAH